MEGTESLVEVPEVCRLCMDDLADATEYFSIDEDLHALVEALTGISLDLNETTLPLIMCTSCYNALVQFNELRENWAVNQEKLREKPLTIAKLDYDEEIVVDNSVIQYTSSEVEDYTEEFIEEYEFVDEEKPDIDEISQQISRQRRPRGSARSDSGKDKNKGKALYQQLLKECSECGKMIEKNRMDGHLNKHKGVRPYVCNNEGCGKSFYCKLLLRLHQKSMHSTDTVACSFCSKTFPSERSLYSHELRHKNANRYECELCNKKFNNGNSLKRHQAIHTGIREFECEFCSASFYRRFNLDVHIKTVHEKDKSYACIDCPKKFGYLRLLREHIKKNHVGTVVET